MLTGIDMEAAGTLYSSDTVPCPRESRYSLIPKPSDQHERLWLSNYVIQYGKI